MYSKEEIGEAIKHTRLLKNMSAVELSEKAGVAKSSISDWENGKTQPSADALFRLCDALGVTPTELITKTIFEVNKIKNVVEVQKFKIPVLGTIACGQPIFTDKELDCYANAINNINCDFAIWAKGDSMIGARIYDGDLVFVKSQDAVENGEIAAVLIGDEATLKRVFYDASSETLTLVAENPRYAPFVFRKEDLSNIKILGKAVAFQSNMR